MQNSLKNYFRIFYNPYKQSIHFEFKGDKGWQDLSESSYLHAIESGKSVVLQNRGWEILNTIDSTYNRGDAGIEVSFYGTETDFHDLTTIFNAKRSDLKPQPFLIRHDQSDPLPSATAAQDSIEKSYEEIKEEFAAYLPGKADYIGNEAIGDAITKFHDILKPKINLSVFGNYSKGKSTFINALIGEELLPVDTDPTTALIYEIEDMADVREICFVYNDEELHLRWDEHTYNYIDTGNSVRESAQEMKSQIDAAAKGKSSAIEKMNAVLRVVNQNCVHMKAQTVNIALPFRNPVFPSNAFSLTVTDTPGSNSDTNKEAHGKVLEEALANQTNTLPILLMDRYFDANDNMRLRDLVVAASKGIDLGNMLVVINKADEMANNQFDIKPEILKSWSKYRIMYVSSIIALGAKKEDDEHWIDNSARVIFNRVKNSFLDKDDEDFKELYKHNIFPGGLSAYDVGGAGADDLFTNSGFGAVFQEINGFAQRYALYLKVKEAREQLLDALSRVHDKCNALQKELEEEKRREETAKQNKKEELVKQIEGQEPPDGYKNSIVPIVKESVDTDWRAFIEGLFQKSKETWEKHRTQKGKAQKKKVEAFHNEMVAEVNLFYERVFPKAKTSTERELSSIQQECIDSVLEIIKSNDTITDEAKRRISNISIPAPQYSASYEKYKADGAFTTYFLFWGVWVNPKKYAAHLQENVETSMLDDIIRTPIKTMASELEKWIEQTKGEYIKHLDMKSIVLKEYDERIKALQERIEDVTRRLGNLQATEDRLTTMLELQHDRDRER